MIAIAENIKRNKLILVPSSYEYNSGTNKIPIHELRKICQHGTIF